MESRRWQSQIAGAPSSEDSGKTKDQGWSEASSGAERSHEKEKDEEEMRLEATHIRRATAADTDTVVRILIASKEASFPETIDDHDRDVPFWTRRWRGYITSGSRARQSRGDGWVFLAEIDGIPVGYIAYHHTTRHGTDAELQNIYVLKDRQGRGVGTDLLGVVAHRLHADGSRTMCVGYDSASPYKRFYMKYGAVETVPDSSWAIWPDVGALAGRLPRPADALMTGLHDKPESWLRRLWPWS